MRNIVSYYLLMVFLLQPFGNLLIVATCQLNKEYITINFCENLDKPKMHCEGTCHLKKKLKSEQEQNSVSFSKEKQVINQFSETLSNHPLLPINCFITFYSTFSEAASQHYYCSVFHPPSV